MNKYRNIRTTVDGVEFASKKEAKRYGDLRLLERAGEIADLELQPKFPIVVNGVKVAKYIADFVYLDCKTGERVVEDVKGMLTREYRLKKKLVKALHGIDVKEI
jgi:hypothetical protein